MRCEAARENLKAFCDGELSGLLRWRLQGHLRRCSGCAAERASLQRLNALLLASDICERETPVLIETVSARTLSAGKGRQNIGLKLIGGVAVTAALTLGLLTVPRSHRSSTSLAAEVKQALKSANTWHLKGWKWLDGKQVPWEIWGRKTPFFYREQTGEDIIFDNGAQRVWALAPDAALGRPTGLIVRTAAVPPPDGGEIGTYRNIFRFWSGLPDFVKPEKETEQTSVFFIGDGYYTIDKRAALPIQYEKRYKTTKGQWTAELWRASFNMPLTDAVIMPPERVGYRVVDARDTSSDTPLPQSNSISADGLTVQATPVAMDTRGNILLRLSAWLGNTSLRDVPGGENLFRFSVGEPRSRLPFYPSLFHDDRNRPYINVLWATPLPLADGDRMLLFSPPEPLAQGTPLPRQLTLTLTISPGVATWASSVQGKNRAEIVYTFFFAKQFTWTVSLPEKKVTQPLETYLPPSWRHTVYSQFGPLEATIASRRSTYYDAVAQQGPIGERRASWKRSAVWLEKMAALMPRDRGLRLGMQMNAVNCYRRAEDKQQAAHLLRQIVTESRRHPNWKSYREQAHAALRALDAPASH